MLWICLPLMQASSTPPRGKRLMTSGDTCSSTLHPQYHMQPQTYRSFSFAATGGTTGASLSASRLLPESPCQHQQPGKPSRLQAAISSSSLILSAVQSVCLVRGLAAVFASSMELAAVSSVRTDQPNKPVNCPHCGQCPHGGAVPSCSEPGTQSNILSVGSRHCRTSSMLGTCARVCARAQHG